MTTINSTDSPITVDPFGFPIVAEADYQRYLDWIDHDSANQPYPTAAEMLADADYRTWCESIAANEPPTMDAILEDISIRVLQCSLVETAEFPEDRGLDTHDLHVVAIRRALAAAFLAGHAAGRDDRYAR